MKATAVFLSGLAAMLAGAFIRSCSASVPPEFLTAWCGRTPSHALLTSHAHCAGCVLAATGLGMVVLALAAVVVTGWRDAVTQAAR